MTHRATHRTTRSLTMLIAVLAIAAALAFMLLSSGAPKASAGQDWQSCPAGVQPPCPVAGKKPGTGPGPTAATTPKLGVEWG